MANAEPTVFVVDDDAAVRSGLKAVLTSVSFAAQTFASAQEFLESYRPETPGCLLLDLRMPGMSGLMLQDELNRRGSTLPIIFITAHGDVGSAVDALKNGAVDFVEKPVRSQFLLDKVQCAVERHVQTLHRRTLRQTIESKLALLTDRENGILAQVIRGKSPKSIALELGLSRKTIDCHLTSIREKMGVESTPQLIKLLYESGLLEPSIAGS